MATKKQISDSVLYKIYGGVPDSGGPVDERDVWFALEDKVNSLFKLQHFSVNLPSGGTIPDGLHLATYEDVVVSRTSNERSSCTLPVTPVSLPRNMGINEITPVLNINESGDKILGNPVIPLQSGQAFLLKADTLLNDLMGQFGYEVYGKTIRFTKDLTTYGITKVDMKLLVFEISQYGVTDELPIPADYLSEIEDELIREFAAVMPENGIVNNFSNAGQTVPENAKQK
jgi:hypothetical protein